MNETSLNKRVLEAIAAVARVRFRQQPIHAVMSLSTDLGIDSLGLIGLSVRLQELLLALDFEVADIDIGAMRTVGDVLQLVASVTNEAVE